MRSELVGAVGGFAFRRRGAAAVGVPSLRALTVGEHLRLDARAIGASAVVRPPPDPTATPYLDIEARYANAPELTGARPAPEAPSDPEEGAAFLRATLDGVLDRLLHGRKRVAVLAGGGVDSSALLALTVAWARRSSASAFAVALDFEADGDDRPHLRGVAARLGCDVLRVRPEDAARWMPLVLGGVDGAPFTWCTAPFEVEMLTRARAQGAECVLTGVGGDELFDGQPRSLARLVRAGMPLRALAAVSSMRGFDRPRWPAVAWLLRPLAVELVPRSVRVRRAETDLAGAPSWAGPTLRDVIREEARELAARAYLPRDDAASRFAELAGRPHRLHLAWLRHQESIAADVVRIDPYLDLDLVRAVTSVPPEWLVRGARRRGLLRDAVEELPTSTRERLDKSSFEPALERFVAAAGGFEELRPHVGGERLAALGIVDGSAFADAARAFLSRPSPEDWVTVWPALACEAFLARLPWERSG